MRLAFRRSFTFLLLLATLATASLARAESRVALVIGNNAYRYVRALDNAVADARAFKKELEGRGFQVVFRENADRKTMNDAIDEFLANLSAQTVGVVYYSGHGAQIKEVNYFLPVDLKADKAGDVVNDAVDLSRLLERISQAQAKFALMIVDACRTNPFPNAGRSIGGKALSPSVSSASGIMVVYAAGANQEALDNLGESDRNPNGLFTREFLKAMRTPGLKVQDAVNSVKLSVIEQAKSAGMVQTPAIYDQSVGTFYFTPPAAGEATKPQTQTTQALTGDNASMEALFWQSADKSGVSEAYSAYLVRYPEGQFAALAKIKLAGLQPKTQPAPSASDAAQVSPTAAASDEGRWTKDKQGVITDKRTGLQWFTGPNKSMHWDLARSWASSLSVAGGGWRLASRAELAGLRKQTMPHCFHDSVFDVYGFTDKDGRYCPLVWSGEQRDASSIWLFDFCSDTEMWFERGAASVGCRAFAVRSPHPVADTPVPRTAPSSPVPAQTRGAGRFNKDANNIITDTQTGLQWRLSGTGYDWDKAQSWVNSLQTAGGGWRMPTRSELAGLRVAKQGNPGCYCDPLFRVNAEMCGWAWSGEAQDASYAWLFNFNLGETDAADYGCSFGRCRAFAVRSVR